MANDRGVLTVVRRALDYVAGAGTVHALLYRVPELLRARADHFRKCRSLAAARRLFASAVRLIEIETHSYCNRTCWFCPNSQIDRRSVTHYLDEATFLQVLTDLASIRYRHRISFSRYNEPFGDEIIYERIAQTRSRLPRARLLVYSNGDFLTPDQLKRIAALGVNELHLGAYLPNGFEWTAALAERYLHRAAERLHLRLTRRCEAPGEHISYQSRVRTLQLRLFVPNYARYGTDRGGVVAGVPVSAIPRTSPCTYPITDVYIDYNGQLMPCCHLRSDVPEHQGCALGRVDAAAGSLFRTWTSSRAIQWRRSLTRYSVKSEPCSHCAAREWPDSGVARWLFQFALRGVRVPEPQASAARDVLVPLSVKGGPRLPGVDSQRAMRQQAEAPADGPHAVKV